MSNPEQLICFVYAPDAWARAWGHATGYVHDTRTLVRRDGDVVTRNGEIARLIVRSRRPQFGRLFSSAVISV